MKKQPLKIVRRRFENGKLVSTETLTELPDIFGQMISTVDPTLCKKRS